jgi:hypothetical protein
VRTDLSRPGIDGRQVSETLARYRPSVAVLCCWGIRDAVPRIGPGDNLVRVIRGQMMDLVSAAQELRRMKDSA